MGDVCKILIVMPFEYRRRAADKTLAYTCVPSMKL